MRTSRLREISRIVSENEVSTQEELIELLRDSGYEVTQATVSRDIKELRLIKLTGADGRQYYSAPGQAPEFSDRFRTIFSQTVISVAAAGNLVVLRCHTGMGNAACAALDTMNFPHIVGTIAGDDTIFAAVDTPETALELVLELGSLL